MLATGDLMAGALSPARLAELTAMPEGVVGESRANWIWLADLARTDDALEVAAGEPVMLDALARHFVRVERVAGAAGLPFPLPATGAYDAVVVHGGWDALVTRHGARAVARELRRLVRPGGCACVATANPAHVHRGAGPAALPRLLKALGGGEAARALGAAGFREVRLYYTVPSLDSPRSIIPATRTATAAHERVERKHSANGAMRSRVARAGLHAMLYPGLLCLAYA